MAPRTPRTATVVDKHQLTPGMVRIVLGGDGLEGFEAGEFTDHYVKLRLPTDAGVKTRTYSVREWDAATGHLTIDFVVHGDTGVAGPWATAARPGDTLELLGPGGAYAPDPEADWHLLAGDASVIPAMAVALERVRPNVPTFALIEIDGPAEEQALSCAGDLRLRWLHRSRPPGQEPDLLHDAVVGLDLPAGRGDVFVHGEASSVRALRRHLVLDRGFDSELISATGYWKLRRTEEGWREDKPQWQEQVAADVASPAT